MFGISLTEIAIIVFITLLIIKPQDLPKLFRFLGRSFHYFDSLKNSFLRECNSLNALEEDVVKSLKTPYTKPEKKQLENKEKITNVKNS